MTVKNVKVMESMNKEQEIKVMYDLYQALPQDSYLKKLLKGLPEYCEQQIRNDWAINPLESLESSREAAESSQRTADSFKKDLVEKQNELAKKDKTIDDLEERRAKDRSEKVELREALEKAQEETKAQRLQAAGAEIEIQELKAKLYDYMVGNIK